MEMINPPFDGSKPCAGCCGELREVSALLHNFLTRCDIKLKRIVQLKAMSKLWDLRETTLPETLTHPNPINEELLAVANALREATADMIQDGLKIAWKNDTIDAVEALIPRAAKAVDDYAVIKDAHFEDRRHSQGDENILISRKGSSWAGFTEPKKDTSYNHSVTVVQENGDLTHRVCLTQVQLAPYFKEHLARDPTFYGKVWCPTCKQPVSWNQFEFHPQSTSDA